MATPPFSLARRLRAGETVYSGWCGLPSPIVAELVGRECFPAVTLDGQHGLWDTASVLAAVAQVRQGGAAPIVRIPVGEFATASRALDFANEQRQPVDGLNAIESFEGQREIEMVLDVKADDDEVERPQREIANQAMLGSDFGRYLADVPSDDADDDFVDRFLHGTSNLDEPLHRRSRFGRLVGGGLVGGALVVRDLTVGSADREAGRPLLSGDRNIEDGAEKN